MEDPARFLELHDTGNERRKDRMLSPNLTANRFSSLHSSSSRRSSSASASRSSRPVAASLRSRRAAAETARCARWNALLALSSTLRSSSSGAHRYLRSSSSRAYCDVRSARRSAAHRFASVVVTTTTLLTTTEMTATSATRRDDSAVTAAGCLLSLVAREAALVSDCAVVKGALEESRRALQCARARSGTFRPRPDGGR